MQQHSIRYPKNIRCFLLSFLLALQFLFSQKYAVVKIEPHQQQTCISYTIEPDRTLFYLSKKIFMLPLQTILEFNPNLEKNFTTGYKLFLPVKWIQNWSTLRIEHTVKPQETLYSIAQLYGTTVEKLKKDNKIKPEELRLGFPLLIEVDSNWAAARTQDEIQRQLPPAPAPVNAKVDHYAHHIVQQEETLYSIAKKYQIDLMQLKKVNQIDDQFTVQPGQILMIPQYQPLLTPAADDAPIQIAVLLPLNLTLNEKFTNDPRNHNKKVEPNTEMALKFYAGLDMALDSLSERYQLEIIDAYAPIEPEAVNRLLCENQIFIFAIEEPLLEEWWQKLALTNAEQTKFIVPYDHYFNPKLHIEQYTSAGTYSAYQSIEKQVKYLYQFVKNTPNAHPIFLLTDRNTKAYEYAQGLFGVDSLRTLVYPDQQWQEELSKMIDPTRENLLLLPEKDLVLVSRFLTDFQRFRNNYNLRDIKYQIVGLENWISPSDYIEEELKFELNYKYVSNKYIDFEDPNVMHLLEKAYQKHKIDLQEVGLFAYDLLRQIADWRSNHCLYQPLFFQLLDLPPCLGRTLWMNVYHLPDWSIIKQTH